MLSAIPRHAALPVALSLTALLVGLQAAATEPEPLEGQLSSKFRINPDDPESSVPSDVQKNRNPMEFGYFVQDLVERAETARNNKDYSAVVRYYRAVVIAAPEGAKAWSKLCEAYRLINDREKAARSCKQAIAREGAVLGDFVLYGQLTLQKQEPLTPEEITSLKAVVAHLESDGSAVVEASQLACQLGVRLKDVKMLETCTATLAKAAPDDARTVIFQWDLAVRKGETAQAARLLERAQDLGVPKDNLERMLKFTPGASRRMPVLWAAGGAGLLGALAFALWTARRRRNVPLAQQGAP